MAIIIVMVLILQNSLVYALTEKQELEQEKDKLNSQIEEYEKKSADSKKDSSKKKNNIIKIYNYFFGKAVICDRGITNPDEVSEVIYQLLETKKPCMIARFGSTELYALTNYLGIIAPNHSIWKYIQGKQSEWWRVSPHKPS